MGSSDRRPYLTATVLDQDFLDEAHSNLENDLELIVEIDSPTGPIFASDRNKYVGSQFYEALLTFPTVGRTIGDWLSNVLEFDTISLELSNVDGRFNSILPGGADFDGWINRSVVIELGLRDVASTYTKIFSGFVTDIGGFGRSVKTINIIARNKFDGINKTFPNTVFDGTTFPDIEDDKLGTIIPFIYGDWTVELDPIPAAVPAIVVNGADDTVNGDVSNATNVELVISENINQIFDDTQVYLRRGTDTYHLVPSADVTAIAGDLNAFEIKQETGTAWIEETESDFIEFKFGVGDEFFVHVEGKALGVGFTNNVIKISQDILETFGDVSPSDFDPNFGTLPSKSSPSQDDIAGTRFRVWIQDQLPAMEFVLSLLEQMRLEIFIERETLDLKLNTLHFSDFDASPSFRVENFDVVKNSMVLAIDERNVFNRAKAEFNFLPAVDRNARETGLFKNAAAIAQTKEISKLVVFPNMYERPSVEDQLGEILRLASSSYEVINVNLTWRALLLDIADFVKLDVKIGSAEFSDVPCLIRSIGYDPTGLQIPMRLWSFQMTPFDGFEPGFAGTVGGFDATITEE